MKRTISAMVGQGSVNHNSRKFHAKNTDPERSHLNITYCQENIKAVYHELFDEALERYNAKQTRADRRIEDYYEKIRSGKQEKPFHEIILQVGNKDDMSAVSEDGQLAAAVLDEYMRGFQERNPQLRVFSAHLHMDEATPHLHIDFVPFTTGSKRGLDTRVSLKQALAAQGFKGGTRGDTEWSQWVRSEKEQLAAVHSRAGEIADDGAGTLSQAQNHNDAAGLVFAEKAPGLAADDHNGELITIGLHMDAGTITGVPLDIELAAPHGIARRIMADSCCIQFFVTIHIRFTAFQIYLLNCFRCGQHFIRYGKIRLPGIVAVL